MRSQPAARLEAVLEPDHVLAFLACHQYIQSAVAIHIHELYFVGGLILVDVMNGEVAFTVVLKPRTDPRIFPATDKMNVPFSSQIPPRQPIRPPHPRTHLVPPPFVRFSPPQ